jgi:hypothetical protein
MGSANHLSTSIYRQSISGERALRSGIRLVGTLFKIAMA